MLPAASCIFRVSWLPLPHLAEFFLFSFFPALRVLFSPSVASCAPSALCCGYPVLNPAGFNRHVCLRVLASILAPVFWGAAPSCWGDAEGAARGEQEQTPVITGNGELGVLLLLIASLVQGVLLGFFTCQLSRWVSKLKLFIV